MTLGEFTKALNTNHRVTVIKDDKIVADFYSYTHSSIDKSVSDSEIESFSLEPANILGTSLKIVLKGQIESEEG